MTKYIPSLRAITFLTTPFIILQEIYSLNINKISKTPQSNGIKTTNKITRLYQRKNQVDETKNYSPFPKLPSYNVLTLASSQLELLTQSLLFQNQESKIKSCILYLPHENIKTGQLEFAPSVIHPNPLQERIFIANDAESGVPPQIPKNTLNRLLVGFAHAKSVLPTYPFISSKGRDGSSGAGIGDIEEGEDDIISCALFSGIQTLGVLVIWPNNKFKQSSFWTRQDRNQISRVAYSLSLALTMDYEMFQTQLRTEELRRSLSDNLHQVKNPIQALRTFGKLLQRKIALEEQMMQKPSNSTDKYLLQDREEKRLNDGAVILSLAENIIAQSDRVVDLLLPMDGIVMALEQSHPETNTDIYLRLLKPSDDTTTTAISFQNAYLESINEHNPTNIQENSFITKYKDSDGDIPVLTFIPDIIQPIMPAFEAIALERNIKFIYTIIDEDNIPGIKIIPSLVQEALSNIIDNALKYVLYKRIQNSFIPNPNPKVKLIVQPNDIKYKSGVTIYVQDNGIGIVPSEEKNVFDRGYRSRDALELDINGSGIGLDISRNMIHEMNGTLDVIQLNDDDNLDDEFVTSMRLMLFR